MTYPSAVALLRAHLLADGAVAAVVGERIGVASPQDTTSAWLRLTRIGGVPSSPRHDRPDIQVDAFAPSEVDAEALARTALAACRAAVNVVSDEGVLTFAGLFEGIQSVPDTSRTPPTPRYLFGASFLTRALTAIPVPTTPPA